MANKNAAPTAKVTYTELICWSILYQQAKREEFVKKAENAESFYRTDVEEWCRDKISEIDTTIATLRQMYRIENGTDYC